VKPWFNGKVDIAPPVVDLTAKGFMLLGGRLDYIDGQNVPSIVYRRRIHVINLFIMQGAASATREPTLQTMQGFNIQHWTARDLGFFAISDINAKELREFVEKFETAQRPANET
jgi:anti-sigma factor RsiW